METLKAARAQAAPSEAPSLKRSLGTPAIIFMVVAAAAPLTGSSGVMPISFLFSENAAAPTYFVVATIILILFAVGFTAMGKHLPKAGAFYTYIRAGLGRVFGNGAAMLATGAYGLTVIALTVYAGPFAQQLVGTFTGWTDSPWWLWSLIIWVLLATLGYLSVDLSAIVLGILLIAEIAALVILGLFVIGQGGAEGLSLEPLNPSLAFTQGFPAVGIMWAALVFVGFEATAVFRGEAKNPDKTISRATYGAVILLGVLYVFVAYVISVGIGMDKVVEVIGENPSAIIFTLSTMYVSPVFTTIVNILLLGSTFACALSFQNVVNRYQLTLSHAGMLPKFVGKIHPKHRVPSNASIVLSVAALLAIGTAAILGLDPVLEVFTPLIGLLGFAVLTMMLLCMLSVVIFFSRHQGEKPGVWTRIIAPVLAAFGLGFVLLMSFVNIDVVAGTPAATIMVVCLMIGLPLLGALLGLRKDSEVEDIIDAADELAAASTPIE